MSATTDSNPGDDLCGVAIRAAEAIRAVTTRLDPSLPDWALAVSLEFVADALDRAADKFEQAAMVSRKSGQATGGETAEGAP